jgi:cytochrome c peroxidase
MAMRIWPVLVIVTLFWTFSTEAWAFEILQPLPAQVPVPDNNPLTDAKIALGKQLYFDRRLSLTGTVSCNSCHNVMAGGQDDKPVSTGAAGKSGTRNAPTVWNVAFQTVLYWDGRARSLEEQLHSHFLDETVMAMPDGDAVQKRLAQIPGYRKEFAEAFGDKASPSYDTAIQAIASYIRTLVTPDSNFDRYIRGDKTALSPQAQRGLNDFRNVGCMSCHFGVNFAGPAPGPYLKMGDGFYELFPNFLDNKYVTQYKLTDDVGRYAFSHDPGEKRMFRVPILRNIALTAPYFHNGSVTTLSEAVRLMERTELNLPLSDREVQDIIAFLENLTGHFPTQTMPRIPPTPNDVVWSWQNPAATESAVRHMNASSQQP